MPSTLPRIQPTKHAEPFVEESKKTPEIFHYTPIGPYPTTEDLVNNLYYAWALPNPGWLLMTVFDKTKPDQHNIEGGRNGALAGIVAYLNSEPQNLKTEIGAVFILPAFHKTHVASNTIGLLLNYALNLPSAPGGGLGLRRVVWYANALNVASVRLAERMGFVSEGVARWERALPMDKDGNGLARREGDPRADWPGRDTARLALCWDEWEDGVKNKVAQIIQRKS